MHINSSNYRPGMYTPKRPRGMQLAENYFRELDRKLMESKKKEPEMPPSICFSRKIGVGALEIADILSEKTGHTVVDREILEHIVHRTKAEPKNRGLFR